MRDRILARSFTKMPCLVCGSGSGVTGHHLLTVGAYPQYKNVPENIIPLCFSHHREVHDKGLSNFVDNNNLHTEMSNRGFDFSEFNQKWFIPKQ